MGLISPGDLRELRSFQNSLMEASCRVERHYRGEDGNLDTTTGLEDASGYTEVYSGLCRYSTARGGAIIVLGDGTYAPQSVNVFIPWDAALPLWGDTVVLTAAPDPAAVGAVLIVQDVEKTQYLTARKLTCTTQQQTGQHEMDPETP